MSLARARQRRPGGDPEHVAIELRPPRVKLLEPSKLKKAFLARARKHRWPPGAAARPRRQRAPLGAIVGVDDPNDPDDDEEEERGGERQGATAEDDDDDAVARVVRPAGEAVRCAADPIRSREYVSCGRAPTAGSRRSGISRGGPDALVAGTCGRATADSHPRELRVLWPSIRRVLVHALVASARTTVATGTRSIASESTIASSTPSAAPCSRTFSQPSPSASVTVYETCVVLRMT